MIVIVIGHHIHPLKKHRPKTKYPIKKHNIRIKCHRNFESKGPITKMTCRSNMPWKHNGTKGSIIKILANIAC